MAGVVETLATVTDFKRHPRQKYGSAQGFFWWFSEIKRRKTNPRWYHSPEIKNSEIKTRGTKLSSLPDTCIFNQCIGKRSQWSCLQFVPKWKSSDRCYRRCYWWYIWWIKTWSKEKSPWWSFKTMGLYKTLNITVGSRYDLTVNVDIGDGLTNGPQCVVQDIDYRVAGSQRPSITRVTFSNACIENKQHKEYSYLSKNKMENLTPIFEITIQLKISNRNQLQILRRQFPLRAAAAKTIHCCQGDTLIEDITWPLGKQILSSNAERISHKWAKWCPFASSKRNNNSLHSNGEGTWVYKTTTMAAQKPIIVKH